MKKNINPNEDNEIFKIKGDGTVVREDNTVSNSKLDKELLEIIEVNSYSKNILAAYKGRKLANKICKMQYGKANYKEYVEMLMIKHFPKEHTKSGLGRKYVRWFWVTIVIAIVPFFCLVPSALLLWLVVIPIYKKLKNLYQ
jgi:hypothetical protein